MKFNIKKVRNELKRLKWTQERLGQEMNMERRTINAHLSRPNTSKTFKTIEKFARALGMDPKDLII